MGKATPTKESLWRQIIVPVIAGITLMAISAFVGYIKLIRTSIADPYAGNIYWEPCLKQPFSQTGRCSFNAYRVVNKSCEPTEGPIKFDFEIYKPADAQLIPTRLSKRNPGEHPNLVDAEEELKTIIISSSEVETEFEVYIDRVTLWNCDQKSKGWHRIIAILPDSIPANDIVDIVMTYCSYSPIYNVRIGPEPLTINGVAYPDVDTNNRTIVERKAIIAQQRHTLVLSWVLFIILIVATFVMCTWVVKKYTQYRSNRAHLQEDLNKLKEGQRKLRAQQEEESKLAKEFGQPQ